VVDGISGFNNNWATYYSGLFAPNSADYRLEGLSEGQWCPGWRRRRILCSAAGDRKLLAGYLFRQLDGKNHPSSVPVSIWTMQCLLTEWPIEKMPVEAVVREKAAMSA